MTAIVRFRTPQGDCAVPVAHVTEVRLATGMRPLPQPREGVAGLLSSAGGALTVLSVLGSVGHHVMVVEDGTLTFGLLVDEVLGVQHVDDEGINPAPSGQDRAVVAGVLADDGAMVLLLDLAVLRGRLVE